MERSRFLHDEIRHFFAALPVGAPAAQPGACRMCGIVFQDPSAPRGRGRPALYCGVRCRRFAEGHRAHLEELRAHGIRPSARKLMAMVLRTAEPQPEHTSRDTRPDVTDLLGVFATD